MICFYSINNAKWGVKMKYIIEAACGCNTGKIRKNNEDNFFFDRKYLKAENNGLEKIQCYEKKLKKRLCFAVFDGIGGERFGEVASYSAAKTLCYAKRKLAELFGPDEIYLNQLSLKLNAAVVKVKKELVTNQMGSTMVLFYFSGDNVYSCNLGDSRAYRFRNGELLQLSKDHSMQTGRQGKKAPITQFLGIDPEDMEIEPYIMKSELEKGDIYLICSDGVTDMLTDEEIKDILSKNESAEKCMDNLIQSALDNGGRDNTTAIICKIK